MTFTRRSGAGLCDSLSYLGTVGPNARRRSRAPIPAWRRGHPDARFRLPSATESDRSAGRRNCPASATCDLPALHRTPCWPPGCCRGQATTSIRSNRWGYGSCGGWSCHNRTPITHLSRLPHGHRDGVHLRRRHGLVRAVQPLDADGAHRLSPIRQRRSGTQAR